jgi:hypothetical protein
MDGTAKGRAIISMQLKRGTHLDVNDKYGFCTGRCRAVGNAASTALNEIDFHSGQGNGRLTLIENCKGSDKRTGDTRRNGRGKGRFFLISIGRGPMI